MAVNWALLSRWKQISSTLMHSTYVANSFSYIDSRTANVERALNDLEPLLGMYAISSTKSRVTGLRNVLQKGANFAFIIFGHPSFWKFDWEVHEEEEGVNSRQENSESIGTSDQKRSIVLWPGLVQVIDGEGTVIENEGNVLTKQKYFYYH